MVSTESERSSLGPHFDALSATESRAFSEFKQICEKNGVSWPVSELEGDPASGANDDTTLLRYLRARSYDPQAAFKQYNTSAAWRRKHQLEHAYDNVEVTKFERTRRLLPQWTGRRDKNGMPVFVYVVSEICTEDVVKTGKEDPDLTSVFLPAEYVTQFVQPLATKLHPVPGTTVSASTNIIDLSGVGVRSFWTLRNLLQTSSTMATAHYPESVERIFVVGAPSFFPTVWGFITRWFEPATTSKISILPASDVKSTLSKYIDVDHIPKRFGGNLDWTFGMHPILDDETATFLGKDLADCWAEGPVRYLERPEGEDDVVIAVGKDNGRTRREVLLNVPKSSSRDDEAATEVDLSEKSLVEGVDLAPTAAVTA